MDDFCRRFSGYGEMKLVLDNLEEQQCLITVTAVISAALFEDVSDFLVSTALAGSNFTDTFQQLVKIIRAETLVELQTLVIQNESLGDKFVQGLRSPNAKPGRLGAINAVTNGNDGVKVIEVDLPGDIATAFPLNSSNFSNSCLWGQLS